MFIVRHSDQLYHVGWQAYEGPAEPFGAAARADLEAGGCELALE